jgi:hypothetical protein
MLDALHGLNLLRMQSTLNLSDGNAGDCLSNLSPDRASFLIPFLTPTGAWGIRETFRFTSVSLSRTVGRITLTRDQLIARPIPTKDNTNTE